jgi:hypothetical protein
MPSNDNDKANTAASGRRTKQGVTPLVSTATGVFEAPHNNLKRPGNRASKKSMITGDAATTTVTVLS